MSDSNYHANDEGLNCDHAYDSCKSKARHPAEPFPFFDLPKEIRYMILELLLVRGQVALCSDREIRERIPRWNKQRPAWALLSVNRQMSAEAADIAFSSRNTFFVPLGGLDIDFDPRWPPIKKLDCAFNICDVRHDHLQSLGDFDIERYAYDSNHEQGSFEHLPLLTKLDILHERKLVTLRSAWVSLAEAVMSVDDGLELLRIDLKDCRCPIGCCWLGLDVIALLEEFSTASSAPQRIEIIGAPEQEKRAMKRILGRGYGRGEDRVFFVDREASLPDLVAENV